MDYVQLLIQFLGVLAVATTGVWAVAEGLGRALPKVPNIWFALVLGPLAGYLAWGAGWLPAPSEADPVFGGGFAALMGLCCTFGAKHVNDRWNPLKKPRPGTVPPGGGVPE